MTPSRASIETVKAVEWRARLERDISSRWSCLARSGVEREADEAAAMLGHEVDGVGRRHLRRDDEVALVLALLGIDEDEHAPVAGVLDDLLDGRERRVVAGLADNVHGQWSCLCGARGRSDALDVARQQIDLKVYQIAGLAGLPMWCGPRCRE